MVPRLSLLAAERETRELLSEERLAEYRSLVTEILLEDRKSKGENEVALRAELAAVDKRLEKGEARLLAVDDDMIATLTKQIRELRE
jgi:hypothetical protein